MKTTSPLPFQSPSEWEGVFVRIHTVVDAKPIEGIITKVDLSDPAVIRVGPDRWVFLDEIAQIGLHPSDPLYSEPPKPSLWDRLRYAIHYRCVEFRLIFCSLD